MNDFNTRAFNPQPDPPKDLGLAVAPPEAHLIIKLKPVYVTSYQTGGSSG